MRKIVLRYGLISGAIVAGLMCISMLVFNEGNNSGGSMAIGYATMLLAFSLVFMGIKVFRDKHNGGAVSFGKAFMVGFYIALISSTVYVAVWALEYKFVFPDFMDKYSARMIREVKASGGSDAQIAEKLKQMSMYRDIYINPLYFTLMTYAEILPVGILVSLVAALILKRKKKADSVAS